MNRLARLRSASTDELLESYVCWREERASGIHSEWVRRLAARAAG